MYDRILRLSLMKSSIIVTIFNEILFVNIHEVSSVNTSRPLDDVEGKIIGGKPIGIESLPSAVQFFNFGSMCSGSIINSWSVLTAAHCLDQNKNVYDMIIQVGARYTYDYDAKIYQVSDFVMHNNYSKAMPFACDIALIFVDESIAFGDKVKKAVIVTSSRWMNEEENRFVAAGWGWTHYGGPISKLGLMRTHLRFIPKKQCERMHSMKLTPDMFCLYGDATRDTCRGDSGGGVLWKGMIVGVVSHGDGCSRKNKPSIYSNVWYFRKWIKLQIRVYIKKLCEKQLVGK